MSYKHDIIKFRRGTASDWVNSSPQPGGEVLNLGEPGYEKDTGKIKIGDGVTGWNDLEYVSAGIIVVEDIDHLINDVIQPGSGIVLNFNDSNDTLTISSSGINNPLNNRILTSDGTNTGINAETALTFDGFRLRIDCACPSGNAGLTVIGDGKPSTIVSAVYDNPSIIETEDGELEVRNTNRLLFLGARGSASSPSGLSLGDNIFNIRGDAYNPHGTLNLAGVLDNRTIRIRAEVSNEGTHYIGSSIIFDTSSGGSGLYDHSMVFDHNGVLSIDGNPIGNLGDNFDVNLAGLSDGDLIRYNYNSLDPASSKWEPYSLNANDIDFSAVPTSDPGQAGKIWRDTVNGNVLKVSAGPW